MKTFREIMESEETINIEFLDAGNTWRRVEGGIQNRTQSIARALEQVKKTKPKSRVRAIGSKSGKLYDMTM